MPLPYCLITVAFNYINILKLGSVRPPVLFFLPKIAFGL